MARVTWEVSDGYMGKSRPQYTDIDDCDLADCETEEEREMLIDDYIQSDFDQKISFYVVSLEE